MSDLTLSTPPATASRPDVVTHTLWGAISSRLVIAVPYLWLLVLFLVPFLIVFKISLSQTAIAMPPYTPTFDLSAGISGLWEGIREFSFDNYLWLVDDTL